MNGGCSRCLIDVEQTHWLWLGSDGGLCLFLSLLFFNACQRETRSLQDEDDRANSVTFADSPDFTTLGSVGRSYWAMTIA